jgi:hypothetical protein
MPTVIDSATGTTTTFDALPTVSNADEDLPTVTVQAKRIPWYAWVAVGAVVGFVAGMFLPHPLRPARRRR